MALDYPSFHDESREYEQEYPALKAGNGAARQHPTARTMSFELGADPLALKPVPVRKDRDRTKSKYFGHGPGQHSGKENEEVLVQDTQQSQSQSCTSTEDGKRIRTNPFSTSREESERRKRALPEQPTRREVIEAADDSPDRPVPAPRHIIPAEGKGMAAAGGMTSWLGLSDGHGRPKKGVALGTKVRRRA